MDKSENCSAFADAEGAYHLCLRMSEGVGRGVCERARVVVYACRGWA